MTGAHSGAPCAILRSWFSEIEMHMMKTQAFRSLCFHLQIFLSVQQQQKYGSCYTFL